MSRTARVAELIKEEVSRIIREDVSDPRIGFISLTRVEVSKDIENANIFVSILASEEKKQDCMEGLSSATNFVRSRLKEVLSLRSFPQIRFIRDDTLAKGSHVLSLISKLSRGKK